MHLVGVGALLLAGPDWRRVAGPSGQPATASAVRPECRDDRGADRRDGARERAAEIASSYEAASRWRVPAVGFGGKVRPLSAHPANCPKYTRAKTAAA